MLKHLTFITFFLASQTVSSNTVFETDLTGYEDSPSAFDILIAHTQYVGTRFSLTEQTHIDGFGAFFSEGSSLSGNIFGGFAPISSGGFPSFTPNNTPPNLIGHKVFTPNKETYVPISITLDPGDYALVMGSGVFGASGTSALEGFYNPDSTIFSEDSDYFFAARIGSLSGQNVWRDQPKRFSYDVKIFGSSKHVKQVPEIDVAGIPLSLGVLLGLIAILRERGSRS